ncbi:MAG: hypothetical protein ACOYBP_04405 [Microbacteriaceae bacterium]
MTIHRAVLHLGPVKTGTTALAKYLSEGARKQLLPEHLIYPQGELWFGDDRRITKHWHLRRLIAAAPEGPAGIRVSEPLEAELAKVRAESERRIGERITSIFIAEGAGHLLPPREVVATLQRHFDAVDVIVNVRRQDTAIPSWISQQVKSWNEAETRTDLGVYFRTGEMYEGIFDYNLKLDQLTPNESETHTFTLVPYLEASESDAYVLDCFLRAIGEAALPQLYPLGGRMVNQSLSLPVLEMMGELKRRSRVPGLTPRQITKIKDQHFDLRLRFEFPGTAEQRQPSDTFTPWTISPSERHEIREFYRESNAAFFSRVDRTSFPEQWALLESTLLGAPEPEKEHVGLLLIDVTGIDDLEFPAKKSALSLAEQAGYTSLSECAYVRWDADGQWRLYNKQAKLELRPQTGVIGWLRRANRSAYFGLKKASGPLRRSIPEPWIRRIRQVYETTMSETRVVRRSENAETWTPSEHHVLMLVDEPISAAHTTARAQAQTAFPHLSFRNSSYTRA